MQKIFLLYFIIVAVGLSILIIPKNVSSAELIFKLIPNDEIDDRATIIEVRIDPMSKNLNVVEGIINFQLKDSNDLSVEILTEGSVLTIWPTPPEYSSDEKIIRFTGGIPGGFNKESLLFRMRLLSSLPGEALILWTDGTAYLNDGKGTKEIIFSKPVNVGVGEQNLDTAGKSWMENNFLYYAIIILVVFITSIYVYKKFIKK